MPVAFITIAVSKMTGMAWNFDITKHILFYHPNRGSCAVLELFH